MAVIADLTGETISSSYGTLLMVTNTAGISGSIQTVQDGLGANDSALKLSTTVVGVNGSLGVGLDSPEYVIHAQTADDYVGKFESTDAGASIILEDNGSTTDGNRITVTSDALSVATANVTALTVDSSQRVGIGGVPTSSLLELHSASSEDAIKIVDSTNSYATTIGQGDSYTNLFGDSSNTGMLLGFGTPTTGNAKVTITAAGLVGIGVSPSAKLDVYSSATKYVRVHEAGSIGDLQVLTDNGTVPALGIKGTGTADLVNVWDGTTEVFTILDGGFVGIGDDSPGRPLVVSSSQNIIASLESTDADVYLTLSDNGSTLTSSQRIGVTGDDMHFWTDSVERMRIDALGNVSLTKAAGYSDLEITRTGTYTGTDSLGHVMFYYGTDSVGGFGAVRDGTDDAAALQFFTQAAGGANTERMRIDSSGNVGIGTDSPAAEVEARGSLFLTTNITTADEGQSVYFQTTTSGWNTAQAHGVISGKRTDGSNGYLTFSTRGSGTVTERMRIDSSGVVSIKSSGANDTPAKLALWATDVSIVANDSIGRIEGQGTDSGGSAPYLGGKIEFNADADWDTSSSNYYPTRIDFFTQDNTGTDTTTSPRMTIDSAGNVTFSSAATLSSGSSAGALKIFGGATNQGGQIDFHGGTSSDGILVFRTGAASGEQGEAMRISAAGNIGTANAFHVTNGGSATTGNAIYSPASNEMGISTNAVERIRIDSSGNVIIASMPTSDPAIAGALWSDSGTVKISAG